MLLCKRPYNHLYIGKSGTTRVCSWAGKLPLGHLTEKTAEEVWYGPKAQELRNSIEDQSFKYCCKISCPLLSNNSLPDLTEEEFHRQTKKLLSEPPSEFNLAYDFICNHACPSCREENFIASKEYKMQMKKIEHEILPYLRNAKVIMASGNGDVFSSKYMLSLLSKIKPENPDCLIKLETNGVLVKRNWRKIKHLEKYKMSIVVTPNSYERETYTALSGGKDNLDITMESMDYLAYLRKTERIKELKITMVVQPKNFREVPSFVKTSLERFNPDVIQLRPLMQWFGMTQQKHKKQNLMDLQHPDHREFIEVMQHPICKNERVYHWIGNNY